jgi:transcriptional regulator with XRE-family HTH domain
LQIGTRAYQNIESNRAELTVNRLIEIAQLLDVMPTDLLMGGGQIILNSKDKLNSDFEEERKVYKEEILFLRELLKDKLTEK